MKQLETMAFYYRQIGEALRELSEAVNDRERKARRWEVQHLTKLFCSVLERFEDEQRRRDPDLALQRALIVSKNTRKDLPE